MFIFPFNPPGDSGSRLSPLCLLNPLSPRFQSLCLCFRASSLGHFGVSRLCCSDYRNQKLGVAKKVAGGLAIPDPLAQDEAGATSFTARPRSFPDPPAAPHCHPRVGLLNRCSPTKLKPSAVAFKHFPSQPLSVPRKRRPVLSVPGSSATKWLQLWLFQAKPAQPGLFWCDFGRARSQNHCESATRIWEGWLLWKACRRTSQND